MTFRFKTIAATAAAVTLMAAPATASAANRAASLSVTKSAPARSAPARAGTVTTGKNSLAEGPTATYVSIGILAALVVGVLLATGGSDDSDSN
ncbi:MULTISPECIES: hypothetical protein [unclassified Sphingomonas]|uniref:hypothetical protein n=1 Tax=Sphingomonas sp. PvP015 TaxID=3156388 RepID=UPI003390F13C